MLPLARPAGERPSLASGRWSVRTGAALSRPVTPSTLLASAAGTDTAWSLARRVYGPALTVADDRYSLSCTRNAASIRAVVAVARTYERCESALMPVKPAERSQDATLLSSAGVGPK